MKKNLFYLFALICSMSLFTACSDDDEDTSWMVFTTPTEYAEANLTVLINGTEQSYFPVTFAATSANAGTLKFEKIVGVTNDFSMDVQLTKTADGFDIVGEKDLKAGYLISVKGSVALDNSNMYLEVKTSGYALIHSSYGWAGRPLILTRNGEAIDAESAGILVEVKPTAADKVDITFGGAIPGIWHDAGDGTDLGYTVKDVPLTKAADSETYSFSGTSKYGDATVTFEGTVSEDKALTMSIDLNIDSPIVGVWTVKMGEQGAADVIATVTTPEGKIVIPDNVYNYVPAELQSVITQTMTDQQIVGLAKGYLGQYVPYLKSIEFKADGNIDIIYTNIGDATEHTLSGWFNYVVIDGKLNFTPSMAKILGMLMPTDTRSFSPGALLNGGPLPLVYSIEGGVLSVSVDETVIGPTVSFVNMMLPLVGMFMPDLDPDLLQKISDIVNYVDKTIIPTDEDGNPIGGGAKLKVGLKLTK